jgi:hypothetical protein
MMAAEPHDAGGMSPGALLAGVEAGPMIGTASVSVHDGVVVRTTLDPAAQPFLHDHRIEGIPVLPGVMGMEAFAEAARLAAPEMHVVGLEDVDFAAPLKFYRDEPREIVVTAVVRPDGDGLVADCRLTAERLLPGHDRPQRTVHFTGRVRLGAQPLQAGDAQQPVVPPTGPVMTAAQVYSFYFHGPAYQVIESAWRTGETAAARMANPLPANHQPPGLALLTSPRLSELCFQTAGLWQAGREDVLALPMHVGRVRLLAEPAGGPLLAVARQVGAGEFDVAVIDPRGAVVLALDGYRTVPLPMPIPEKVAADLHATFRE